MWEITLIDDISNLDMFIEYSTKIKKIFSEIFLDLGIYKKDNKVVLNISISKNDKIKNLERMIYDLIIKSNKKRYFEEYIHINNDDQCLKLFMIYVLISIDLFKEIDYAVKFTKLSRVVYVSSFMDFKLSSLKFGWSRIIHYINNFYCNEVKDGLYLDFLKFLADNTESQFDVIYLNNDKEFLKILDLNNNLLKKLPISDEIDLIVNLILFSPKKVIINCPYSISKNVFNLISYIFDEKLSVII